MAQENQLTIIVLTHNESDNLKQLLPNISKAAHVIVVDDNSSDSTSLACAQYAVECVAHPLRQDFAAQRNFALSLVKHGWVLFLDADERLDSKDIEKIKHLISSAPHDVAFSIRRIDTFLGKKLRHGETGNTWLVRLAHHANGRWQGQVHETWEVDRVEQLSIVIRHCSHSSVRQLFAVVSHYALLRAKELYSQHHYWNAWEQLVFPPVKFIYTFIIKGGFLDGWPGFLMSFSMAWHSWLVRFNLWTLPWKQFSLEKALLKYTVVIPILLLPFGQLQRAQLTDTIAVNIFEVFMLLAVLIGVFQLKPPRLSRYSGLLIFSALVSLSTLLTGFLMPGSLYTFRWLLYAAYFIVLHESLVQQKLAVSVKGLMMYVGFSLLMGGLIQYVLMPDARFLQYYGWDDHYYRMIGTLFDPNFFGLMMVLAFLFIWFNSIRYQRVVLLLLVTFALVATYSRLSWLLTIVIGICIAALQPKIKKYLLLIPLGMAIALITLAALPKPGGEGVNVFRAFTFSSRLTSIAAGISMFQKQPIIGVGFNNYPLYSNQQSRYGEPYHAAAPDNSFVYIAATTGILGLASFLYFIFELFRHSYSWSTRLTMAAVLIHSLGNNSFFYPWVLMWLWLTLTLDYLEKETVNSTVV